MPPFSTSGQSVSTSRNDLSGLLHASSSARDFFFTLGGYTCMPRSSPCRVSVRLAPIQESDQVRRQHKHKARVRSGAARVSRWSNGSRLLELTAKETSNEFVCQVTLCCRTYKSEIQSRGLISTKSGSERMRKKRERRRAGTREFEGRHLLE